MKNFAIIGTLTLFLLSCKKEVKYGKVVLTEQGIYEENDDFLPHDYFIEEAMGEFLDTAVSISISENQAILTNTYNDGYSGHQVKMIITQDLEVVSITYIDWIHVEDGSEKNDCPFT